MPVFEKGDDAVLDAIKSWIELNGYPPSVREIGQMVGLRSTSTVWGRLQSLKGEGRITFVDRSPRTIVVLPKVPVQTGRLR